MNWQSILYFISILLTCGLTGFLSWYAWRQPSLPGIRIFMALTLSECLLALTEVLSMLGGTQAQALFWFKMRFIFTAIIPIIWLGFTLAYTGRRDWLSKRLLAGILVIPLITQVILWSNSLHGLWVKQEVTFHQNGLFWIVETGARVPGIWFMIHSFYSIILLLAGTGVLLFADWGNRQQYRGQAILLITGALVSLGTGIIPVFNILPQSEFNPFIPGIGFAALLYALAIFQFKFLKHPPARENAWHMTSLEPDEKRSLAILIFIFILLTTSIAASGYLTYQNYAKYSRTQAEHELSAIAKLKVDELVNWREERMGNAKTFHNNPAFAALVQRFQENPGDVQAGKELQAWLDIFRDSSHYDRVFLLDASGVEQISSPTTHETVPDSLIEQSAASMASGQIIFLDFHRHAKEGNIHLSILIPILDAQNKNQPLGTLVMWIDPNTHLYPFIQRWPIPSQSAETLLIRREGEDFVFLNPLRFQSDAALNLRFPLDETSFPTIKAVLGEGGIVQGLDYRGVPVTADIRSVPGLPWLLISKMDTAEIEAPLRARLWQTILLLGVLILAAGTGLMLVWRQQRVKYYKAQVGAANALRASEEKFKLVFDTSPDSVTITRLVDGMFVAVNKSFEQISGYPREQVIGKTSAEINIWKTPENRQYLIEELQATGEVQNYEIPVLTPNGEIYGLMSAVVIQLNGEPHILNITRDITERKKAEKALRESEEKQRTILESMADYVVILDAEGRIQYINHVSPGLEERDVLGSVWLTWVDETDQPLVKQAFHQTIASGESTEIEYRAVGAEKEMRWFRVKMTRMPESSRVVLIAMDITEHKLAEEYLKISENRYRRAQAIGHVGNWEYVMENSHFWGSEEAKRIYGFDPDTSEFIAEEVESCIPDRELVHQALLDLIEKETPYDLEFDVITKDKGETRIIRSIAVLEKNADGKPLKVTGVIQDITERKQAEDALRISEKKYRQLHESMMDGFVCVDMDGTFLECNEVYRNMLGYSEAELKKITYFDLTPEKWHAYEADIVKNQILERGYSDVYEKEYRRKDGTIFPAELHTVLTRDENGNPVNMWGIARDITARKQTEDAQQQSEILFRTLFELSPDAVILLDPHDPDISSPIIDCNAAACLMNGYRRDELIGHSIDIVNADPYTESGKTDYLKKLRDEGNLKYEVFHRHKNGVIFPVETSTTIIKVGERELVIGIDRNITERKQAEVQLLKALEELKRSNTELEQFAYIASHDLQEPLRTVAGMVQLLQQRYKGKLDESADEYIDFAVDGATRMQSLINDLLSYSRVERRGNPFQSTDANEVLKSALRNLGAAIAELGATITNENLPIIEADATQLTQLFQNLIGNAIKFHGELPPQIHIGVESLDDAWRFSVRDNGIGIESKNFERIFLVFQRLHTRREYPGTGIGLSICKKIVERHGGQIWIESEVGQGTTFYFTIPNRRPNS